MTSTAAERLPDMRRLVMAVMALVLCVGASPPDTSDPGLGFVGDWQAVAGPLGGAVPGLQVDYGPIRVWHGGFAALETATHWATDAQGRSEVTWPGPAVWRSTDGVTWTRAEAPGRSADELTLLAWRDGIALVEARQLSYHDGGRYGYHRWRFRVWTSNDGATWRRRGGLTLRPRGSLRGCGLYDPQAVVAGGRLAIVTSCYVERGAGGDRGPAIASVGSDQAPPEGRIPVHAWSTADGRRWTRRAIMRVDEGGVGVASVAGVALAYRWDRLPRVLWTRDGRRWDDISSLPRDGDVRYLGIEPILGADGRPEAWVADGQPGRYDPDPTGGLRPEPPRATLWLGDTDGSWREVAGAEGWAGMSVAVDGRTVVALVHLVDTRPWSRPAATSPWYRLLVSLDGGVTWSHQIRRLDLPRCAAGIAVHGTDVVLRCQGEDVAEALLHASLAPAD